MLCQTLIEKHPQGLPLIPLSAKSGSKIDNLPLFPLSLTKDVDVRPHYAELLEHPLIKEYETKPVNVGEWLRDVEKTIGL